MGLLAISLFLYVLLLGTKAGEQWAWVRLAGSILGAVMLVSAFILRRRAEDVVDRLAILAVLLFLVACVASGFPRQSFDAALSALALLGGFLTARDLLHDERARAMLISVVSLLGASIAIAFGIAWLGIWAAWASAFGLGVAPPLDLPLPSGQFGYRHHVAILVLLTFPAILARLRGATRSERLVLRAGVIFGAFVIYAAGSRAIWVAAIVATLVAFVIPRGSAAVRRRLEQGATRPALAAGVALGAIALLFTVQGFWGPLLSRMVSITPLAARGEIWLASFLAWLERPLAGWGPGSFPFVLRETDYFHFNVFSPRHADNVILQALAEGGMFGVAALAVVVATVVVTLRSSGNRAPRPLLWLMLCIGMISLVATPSDFGFLAVLMVVWVAYGLPRDAAPRVEPDRSPRVVLAVLATPVAIATVCFSVAAFMQETARTDAMNGRYDAAAASLRTAVMLDPGMALYARELGWVQIAAGQPASALDDLSRARRTNGDDVAVVRGLALAALNADDLDAAETAARAAVELQEGDASNLLLLGHVAEAAGDLPTAAAMASRALQQQPLLAASDGWQLLGVGDMPDALRNAASDLLRGAGTTVGSRSASLGPSWLAGLAHEPSLEAQAVADAGPYQSEAALLLRFAACELDAETLLSPPSRPTVAYWEVRLVLDTLLGIEDPDGRALSVYQVPGIARDFTGDRATVAIEQQDEVDVEGYNRRPLVLKDPPLTLPSTASAAANWLSREGEYVAQMTAGCID